jgi:hypothetical protein
MARFPLLLLATVAIAAFARGQERGPANQLAGESSPYLLQHAHNPVHWYPWGDEALTRAKREDKMIFLSVGYAACHWCHVMERESFVDPEIAALLNERFVCIKVDREERPDVDQIYMTAVQMISGNGGWPMSVFLLPDARPFWGGTYFPARDGDRPGATGFISVIHQIHQAWTTQREAVTRQAAALTAMIEANQKPEQETPPTAEMLREELVSGVSDALREQFDPVHGGFTAGAAGPKFPEPSNLRFLLDRSRRSSLPEAHRAAAQLMLTQTLDGMISGAMYDHLGGGFHRYSVDSRWQIPHFEKMLYDNAQLASVYAEAYHETQRGEYRSVVEGICDFVIRELRAPGGAFFSALDADSEGEEGKFYCWTRQELQALAGQEGMAEAIEIYHLGDEPNFEGEYYAPQPGTTLTAAAEQRGEDFATLHTRLAAARQAMFELRSRRQRPLTDVKVLTAWNGLMIAGLADAGRILQREDYLAAAATAADFLAANLRQPDGRLLRSYAAGQAKLNGYVDDYAFFANGLLALHRASGQERWLQLARQITDKQIELFWDQDSGGFFFTSRDHPSLIVRVKDPVDSALPSGNSVAAENLQYLAKTLAEEAYAERVTATLQSLIPLFRQSPAALPRAAVVLAEFLER